MSKTKTQSPAQYFNDRASSYRSDILSDPFLRYFHFQRLEAAVRGRDLSGKRILDIGAGTGLLYDYLQDSEIDADYLACDVSKKMLEQSRIPEGLRYVGEAPDLFENKKPFDGIFILGVSTYLSQPALLKLLNFSQSKLTPNGFVAISFTNRKSVDFWIRQRLKTIIPSKLKKGRVIGSKLNIAAYKLDEVKSFSLAMQVQDVYWLNQSVPFLNRVFPKLAVRMAKVRKRLLPTSFLPLFSSDFLIIYKPQK